jgi:hypothetical protein
MNLGNESCMQPLMKAALHAVVLYSTVWCILLRMSAFLSLLGQSRTAVACGLPRLVGLANTSGYDQRADFHFSKAPAGILSSGYITFDWVLKVTRLPRTVSRCE